MATSTSKKSSRADLVRQRDHLDAERIRIEAEISAQSQADLQALVDAFKEHLKANDFALNAALALLGVGKKTRAKRGTAKPKVANDKPRTANDKPRTADDKPKAGVTYKHPKTGEEWAAPVHLRRTKKWLGELVADTGKKYEDFAVKQ